MEPDLLVQLAVSGATAPAAGILGAGVIGDPADKAEV